MGFAFIYLELPFCSHNAYFVLLLGLLTPRLLNLATLRLNSISEVQWCAVLSSKSIEPIIYIFFKCLFSIKIRSYYILYNT